MIYCARLALVLMMCLAGALDPRVAYAQFIQENPPTDKIVSLSGIQVLSGWKCNPGVITVSFDGGPPEVMASGTSRADTIPFCPAGNNGRNGYGLLKNLNPLGDGQHTARFRENGVQFAEATFQIVRLGDTNFLTDASATFNLRGFPSEGTGVAVTWVQGLQNFMISDFCGTTGNPCPTTGGFPASGESGSGISSTSFGSPLSYSDNGDGTITDNNTGLMWEKKDDAGGLHDKDNTYIWIGADSTRVWLAEINTEDGIGYAGYSDWRIPNIKELQSIVHYGRVDPAVSLSFQEPCNPGCTVLTCSCTAGSSTWSSTKDINYSENAYILSFADGSVERANKTGARFVRAVRGGIDPFPN